MLKRSSTVLFLLVFLIFTTVVGCASPAEDYVRADDAAWKHYDKDGRLDTWIQWGVERWTKVEEAAKAEGKVPVHGPGEISPQLASSLDHLNKGRRARVSHALAAFDKKEGN